MENPESLFGSPGKYRSPRIALIFGFKRPVPITTRISPIKNEFVVGIARTK